MPDEMTEAATPVEVERFNFGRTGHLPTDHQRTLRTLDEQFARNLTYTLGAWLRTDVAVSPRPNEQSTFFVFAERASASMYMVPVRMEPLHVRGALAVQLELMPPMIDLLLGGSGRPAQYAGRDLTEIEQAILGSVLEIILRELTGAWRSLNVEFLLEHRDGDGQDRLMLATERVLLFHFELLMPELRGQLSLCLPASAMNTVLRKLSHRHGRPRLRSPEEREAALKRLEDARVHASLVLPPVRLSAGTLAELAPGRLLRMGLPSHSTGQIVLGGFEVAQAAPVSVGERRGAHLMKLEGHRSDDVASGDKTGDSHG